MDLPIKNGDFHISFLWLFTMSGGYPVSTPRPRRVPWAPPSVRFLFQVPVENGYAIHEACQKAVDPLWLEGYGHNDLPNDARKGSMDWFQDGNILETHGFYMFLPSN